ncbi:3'-5' exoribonuclease [Sphingobacterium sp. ML3W]|uniref:3'-5' exoribonuclease n=1 Tax=Sphingobacterium sp. ML3W TaxID=1538644 RepID=UPI000691522F|nr:3'-5' exoribonuclease [Sphingobacterium sp. ML3W]
MKYFYDTEFLEGKQTLYSWGGLTVDLWLRFIGCCLGVTAIAFAWIIGIDFNLAGLAWLGLVFGAIFFWSLSMPSSPETIDLISIGIVADDGREYYAVSKEFNLKEAWNRCELKDRSIKIDGIVESIEKVKMYWIRENVLLPLWRNLFINTEEEWYAYANDQAWVDFKESVERGESDTFFTYKSLKRLINKYGVGRAQIAEDIKSFCNPVSDIEDNKIELYGYYSAYDHVVFCWLFGKMIDLPEGFPMFTIDLKQMMESHFEFNQMVLDYIDADRKLDGTYTSKYDIETIFSDSAALKKMQEFPQQNNEHLAISDARWNRDLYYFLNQ